MKGESVPPFAQVIADKKISLHTIFGGFFLSFFFVFWKASQTIDGLQEQFLFRWPN